MGTLVSIEEWDLSRPVARTLLPPPGGASGVVPDVPNWAWHDYGMRVGVWRLLDALARRKLRASTALNARVCDAYPEVARAMRDAGWEFVGPGVVQMPMHRVPDEGAALRARRSSRGTGRPATAHRPGRDADLTRTPS